MQGAQTILVMPFPGDRVGAPPPVLPGTSVAGGCLPPVAFRRWFGKLSAGGCWKVTANPASHPNLVQGGIIPRKRPAGRGAVAHVTLMTVQPSGTTRFGSGPAAKMQTMGWFGRKSCDLDAGPRRRHIADKGETAHHGLAAMDKPAGPAAGILFPVRAGSARSPIVARDRQTRPSAPKRPSAVRQKTREGAKGMAAGA